MVKSQQPSNRFQSVIAGGIDLVPFGDAAISEILNGIMPVMCTDGAIVRLNLDPSLAANLALKAAKQRMDRSNVFTHQACDVRLKACQKIVAVHELGQAFLSYSKAEFRFLRLQCDATPGHYFVTEGVAGSLRIAFEGTSEDSARTVARLAEAYLAGVAHARSDADRVAASVAADVADVEAARRDARRLAQKKRRAAARELRATQCGEPDIDAVLAIMGSTGPLVRPSA